MVSKLEILLNVRNGFVGVTILNMCSNWQVWSSPCMNSAVMSSVENSILSIAAVLRCSTNVITTSAVAVPPSISIVLYELFTVVRMYQYIIHDFYVHHTDVNECETGKHECHMNAECNNIVGSYTCTCQEGYFGDGFQCAGIYMYLFFFSFRMKIMYMCRNAVYIYVLYSLSK